MTYTVIAGTDTLSATRTVLNGVATRVAPLEFRDTLDATNPPAASQQGLVKTLNFTATDVILPTWVIDDRVARNVDPVLQLDLVTTAAEAAKFVGFDVALVASDPAANTDLAVATATVNGADLAVPTTAGKAFRYTLTIPNAHITATTVKSLGLQITRVAPAGADATTIGLYGLSVLVGIDR